MDDAINAKKNISTKQRNLNLKEKQEKNCPVRLPKKLKTSSGWREEGRLEPCPGIRLEEEKDAIRIR